MKFFVLDSILNSSRLPLKLAPPTVLQALALFLVVYAVTATFSFGEGKKNEEKNLIVDLMAEKKHFYATNAAQKIAD